ncbi:hypothetical protein C8F01DRAFT_1294539 [Mycena amicta]|nr:hypothetical protein C8F01DRAFT_1294539 [Mycena amicta]
MGGSEEESAGSVLAAAAVCTHVNVNMGLYRTHARTHSCSATSSPAPPRRPRPPPYPPPRPPAQRPSAPALDDEYRHCVEKEVGDMVGPEFGDFEGGYHDWGWWKFNGRGVRIWEKKRRIRDCAAFQRKITKISFRNIPNTKSGAYFEGKRKNHDSTPGSWSTAGTIGRRNLLGNFKVLIHVPAQEVQRRELYRKGFTSCTSWLGRGGELETKPGEDVGIGIG